jgi:hypothetical protein
MAKIQLQKFEIQLNGNRKVYYNNNQINGICLIQLNGELDLKQLKIRLNGEALAKWSERQPIVKKRAETYQHKFICLALNYDLMANGIIQMLFIQLSILYSTFLVSFSFIRQFFFFSKISLLNSERKSYNKRYSSNTVHFSTSKVIETFSLLLLLTFSANSTEKSLTKFIN